MKLGIDCIGVAVVFYCHDGKGRVLMQLRNQNVRDEKGKWDIGGGALEKGERIVDALKREIKEEYLSEVLDYQFLGYRDVHRVLEDGSMSHWISLDYKVRINDEMVGNGEPHKFDEVKWFSCDDIPINVHSQLPLFLKNYQGIL